METRKTPSRKGLSLFRTVIFASIFAILVVVVTYFATLGETWPLEGIHSQEDMVRLSLPADFSGNEMPQFDFEGGYIRVTYEDTRGDYKTATYGWFADFPKNILWVKPEIQAGINREGGTNE